MAWPSKDYRAYQTRGRWQDRWEAWLHGTGEAKPRPPTRYLFAAWTAGSVLGAAFGIAIDKEPLATAAVGAVLLQWALDGVWTRLRRRTLAASD